MIKKLFIAALLAAPLCLSAQNKIGSVNTQEILLLMPEIKQAQTTLEAVSKQYEEEFQNLQNEFNKKLQEYQALAQDTPESIRQRREQDLQELDTKIRNFQEAAGRDMSNQQEQLMVPIREKVMSAIKSVGDENGFSYIFDLASPSIVYTGKDAIDITPLVKQKLNLKDTPATTTTPAAPAATNTPAPSTTGK